MKKEFKRNGKHDEEIWKIKKQNKEENGRNIRDWEKRGEKRETIRKYERRLKVRESVCQIIGEDTKGAGEIARK